MMKKEIFLNQFFNGKEDQIKKYLDTYKELTEIGDKLAIIEENFLKELIEYFENLLSCIPNDKKYIKDFLLMKIKLHPEPSRTREETLLRLILSSVLENCGSLPTEIKYANKYIDIYSIGFQSMKIILCKGRFPYNHNILINDLNSFQKIIKFEFYLDESYTYSYCDEWTKIIISASLT